MTPLQKTPYKSTSYSRAARVQARYSTIPSVCSNLATLFASATHTHTHTHRHCWSSARGDGLPHIHTNARALHISPLLSLTHTSAHRANVPYCGILSFRYSNTAAVPLSSIGLRMVLSGLPSSVSVLSVCERRPRVGGRPVRSLLARWSSVSLYTHTHTHSRTHTNRHDLH